MPLIKTAILAVPVNRAFLPFHVAHNPTRFQNMGINVSGKLKDLLNGESGLDPHLPEQFPCSMCWCSFMTIYSLLKAYSQVLSKSQFLPF